MGLSIQQNQGVINGQFTVGSALVGSGPFIGIVDTNKHLHFTVQSYNGNAPLLFIGSVRLDGSLAGTYCSTGSNGRCDRNAGAGGIWHVSRKTADIYATSVAYRATAITTAATATATKNDVRAKKGRKKHS